MTLTTTHLVQYPSPMDPEPVDKPTIYDLDIRQEANLRLFKHYQKKGEPFPMTATDLAKFHLEHEDIVVRALNHSVVDQVRKIKGQGSAQRTTVPLSDLGPDFDISDPTATAALEAVESTPLDELEAFLKTANTAEREAVGVLRECQKLIEQGKPLPDSYRSRLKRLRRQTGLALDVSLL